MGEDEDEEKEMENGGAVSSHGIQYSTIHSMCVCVCVCVS